MSLLSVSNLCYRFPDGKVLFSDLSFSLKSGVTALLGNNGVGKSMLAEILTQAREPASGNVLVDEPLGYFKQITDTEVIAEQSIADVLNVSTILESLDRIQSGNYDDHDLNVVGEQWCLRDKLEKELNELDIPLELSAPCGLLSGGQLTRLMLSCLFNTAHELLILDEPGNHLDREARRWLNEQIRAFSGSILLITHDQEILQSIHQFLILDTKSMRSFDGTYEQLQQHEERRKESIEREFDHALKHQKQVAKTRQQSIEKAQQRRKQGQKLRHSGSQAKSLLDLSKMSAEKSMSKQRTQFHRMEEVASEAVNSAKDSQEVLPPVNMTFTYSTEAASLQLVNVVLPFGSQKPVNLQLNRGDKLALQGNNGSGKSTLLKIIARQLKAKSGSMLCNGWAFYIDQYFSLLGHSISLLDCTLNACSPLSENKGRALLAAIGFRGEAVNKCVDSLSGGEKMRLTLMIAGNQPGKTLLLLDEPDNHLDLSTKKQLAVALGQYQGSFILVSHSDTFTEAAKVTRHYHLN